MPFQHKTRTVQLSALAHFLFFRISPPTHSPHNINLISSFSFLAISNCFHFSTTLILDWRPTSFCCVRAKCWIGISPLAALGWHITFFSGHVGGLRLLAWDIVTDSIWLVFRVQILSHHLLELNAPILFSACDPHVSRHRWSSLS